MKRRSSPTVRLLVVGLLFGTSLLACDLLGGGGGPTLVISSPPSGSTYHEGDDVAVRSTSADAQGITRVELTVDGVVVRNDIPPSPQTNFSLIQIWKATQGTHTIVVRAYNAAGAASDPAAISIQVSPSVALNNPTPTSTTAPSVPTNTSAPPTSAPPPTTAPPPGGTTCTNNAVFVTDVTVPDGTNFAAGQTFNKVWRMSNSGTCTWTTSYQFVFISGEAMTSNTIVSVPATAPGATADILVPMTTPTTSGNHAGQWRMRSADGTIFGQTVSVKITVPGAPPPPSGCSGNPVIASFTAASTTIVAGSSTTLNWGAVTNADSVEIDNGIGGVPTPGSISVSPGSTTTYTMTAHCGSNTTTAQVTITVNPAPSVPTPNQLSPSNGLVLRVFPRVAQFTWSSVSYPGGVSYNIEIQINTGSWQPKAVANGLSGTTYNMSAFSGDNPGRWRVWATSPTAGDGPKSGWWSFSFNTSASQYAGNWFNDDASTSGITKIIITNSGQTLTVHPYGKCTPTDCDWGTANQTFNGEPFNISGFSWAPASGNQLTITLDNPAGTSLKVVYVNIGRTYYFHR